ncbi:hypothetical protein [Rhizobium binxianense]|uniref:hypothetical protein n=1 Tax=Rhizobium binxianense TaxID=3024242 RepID=UPI00235EE4A2|nr:hypothetical protein [Rhizobium sp. MJ37]MDC9835136.1 hypothetical protein [Rhizobium sp. MJ37]
MNAKVTLLSVLLLAGCGSTQPGISSPNSGAISAATNAICGFVPAGLDIADLFGVPGAAKAGQAASIICAAVEKRKKELIAQKNASELAGEAPITKLPAGTKISVVINGKTVTGLTSR